MATQLAFDGLLETAAVTPVRRGGGVEERREPQACADAEANDGGQAEELITVEWPVRARVGVPELMPPETATGWALDNLYRVVYNLYRNQDREDRDDTENSRNL